MYVHTGQMDIHSKVEEGLEFVDAMVRIHSHWAEGGHRWTEWIAV